VIDRMGYLPLDEMGATIFFQLASARYERGSIILTSNKSYGDWGSIFGDPIIATAIPGSAAAPFHDGQHPRGELSVKGSATGWLGWRAGRGGGSVSRLFGDPGLRKAALKGYRGWGILLWRLEEFSTGVDTLHVPGV